MLKIFHDSNHIQGQREFSAAGPANGDQPCGRQRLPPSASMTRMNVKREAPTCSSRKLKQHLQYITNNPAPRRFIHTPCRWLHYTGKGRMCGYATLSPRHGAGRLRSTMGLADASLASSISASSAPPPLDLISVWRVVTSCRALSTRSARGVEARDSARHTAPMAAAAAAAPRASCARGQRGELGQRREQHLGKGARVSWRLGHRLWEATT